MPREPTDDEELISPAALTSGSLGRRRFLGLVGAGTVAATLPACGKSPPEHIVPYVNRPPEVTPGVPTPYATSTVRNGYAIGLIGESREGRPVKVEGHPAHPASLGATGAQEQALVYGLYDPDRLEGIREGTTPRSWGAFADAFGPGSGRPYASSDGTAQDAGRGLHLWLEPTTSPTVGRLLDLVQRRYPAAKIWFDPTHAPTERWRAAEQAFGRVLEPRYDFTGADRVVALDADFTTREPSSLRWARDFARTRQPLTPEEGMSRLYVAEPSPTPTGTLADHRLPVPAGEIRALAAGLLAHLADFLSIPAPLTEGASRWKERAPHQTWLAAVAKDLAAHREQSIVIAGDRQPAEVHALVFAINEALGNVGHTVEYVPSPIHGAGTERFEPEGLHEALDQGRVDTLFVLTPNPAFTTPRAWGWSERMQQATERVHLTQYANETAALSTWRIPARHDLEDWGDGRAPDGTLTIRQPLIRPLYEGRSILEVLAVLLGQPRRTARGLLREHWRGEVSLDTALAKGFVPDSGFPPVEPPAVDWSLAREALRPAERSNGGLELDLTTDLRIHDGRHANNPWLQECPEPITKLVWDNALLVDSETAAEQGIENGDVVEVRGGGATVQVPAWVQPGQAKGVLVAWLGFGRRGDERVANGVGVDVGPLRPSRGWIVEDVELRRTGRQRPLVTTQDHDRLAGGPIILDHSLEHWREHPDFAHHLQEEPPTLYPKRLESAPQWGMVVDLAACTGCSACVVACQAENNIPVVGKEQCAMGREMHWIRIDRYYTGEGADARAQMQPMLCQHCEKAPCEYVCPVNATVHSPDGLNEMVYNRCVGTRFCSNNCPYKVRRFNWFDFNRGISETEKMAKNPDVTVRARGVMEKCTYCVQRLRRAEIEAKLEGEPLSEQEVNTACEQACPTSAITFGLISDDTSEVSRHRESSRQYAVLHDTGAQPRTRYLAHIRHLNPEIVKG